MSPWAAWRLPLRLARRDALRHRARSGLVLTMIALPVLAVTAADVLIATQQVSGAESVERRMGAAQALVTVTDGVETVRQGPDPESTYPAMTGGRDSEAPPADEVSSLLDGARLLELRRGQVQVTTDRGRTSAEALETDLRDPLTRGLHDLVSGRLPRDAGEVVVNQALLDKGYAVGERLGLGDEEDGEGAGPTIVGVAESAVVRTFPAVFGPLGATGVETPGTRSWLVDGAPVSWATVRQLNEIGALVASRAVIEDPPPASEWPAEVQPVPTDDSAVAVGVLIAVMALIEVVLLAGPAFAVTARKQQRSLALIAATGGTPRQARRVLVASAVVLGGAAAVAGVGLGIATGWALRPVLQGKSDTWFGPFEVPWLHLLGVASFGLLSALLAALVPARLASRQDVVAVLAGRRGDAAPSLRSPLVGLALLGLGVAGSAAGATGRLVQDGEVLIAASAVPAVLGTVLLVPVVLAGVARVSGRLPLVLRYAVRDANRHRTRTVPAVSAVAATVAGVVALGIGLSSDEAENVATYTPTLPAGVGVVVADPDVSWRALRSVVEREVPGGTVTELRGLPEQGSWTEVRLRRQEPLLLTSGGALGASVMVSDQGLPVGLIGVSAADRERAAQGLRAGGVVAFTSTGAPADGTEVELVTQRYDPDTGDEEGSARTRAPATFIEVDGGWVGPTAVVATPVTRALDLEPVTVSLAVTGVEVTERQQEAVDEGLAAVSEFASLYVERGYQPDDAVLIAQLVLLLLGGVLMLGGTLTATFLALSDARPDLATLAAVGASPRTRRGVAASYAVVVGSVGAVLGAVVGAVPGIAVSRPLTTTGGDGTCQVVGTGGCDPAGAQVGPFLDVPWLMLLALVVLLPTLTALVVGLTARSRLPLVARLD